MDYVPPIYFYGLFSQKYHSFSLWTGEKRHSAAIMGPGVFPCVEMFSGVSAARQICPVRNQPRTEQGQGSDLQILKKFNLNF